MLAAPLLHSRDASIKVVKSRLKLIIKRKKKEESISYLAERIPSEGIVKLFSITESGNGKSRILYPYLSIK